MHGNVEFYTLVILQQMDTIGYAGSKMGKGNLLLIAMDFSPCGVGSVLEGSRLLQQ